jgi:hypothetical protein
MMWVYAMGIMNGYMSGYILKVFTKYSGGIYMYKRCANIYKGREKKKSIYKGRGTVICFEARELCTNIWCPPHPYLPTPQSMPKSTKEGYNQPI